MSKPKFYKMDTSSLSKTSRTHVKCSICGEYFDVNDKYMWLTTDLHVAVCYNCAENENEKTRTVEMNKTEFNKRMAKAMEQANLTEACKDVISNLLHQEIIWDLLKEIGLIK